MSDDQPNPFKSGIKKKNKKDLSVDTGKTSASNGDSEKSQNRDAEEDAALDLVMDRLKFYRKEYKRLLKENGELWEENQKIKTSYNQLKNDASALQNLMKMVTGEMGSALNLMEQAKTEGEEALS